MAYDKPLKMQWIEVDGRTVPLVLPQYWSDEQDDWVVSSEQNRLPVDAQLTGSIAVEVFERKIRTDRETINYSLPGNAIGVMVFARVYGLTGIGPSFQLVTRTRHPNLFTFMRLNGDLISIPSRKALHVWQPGAEVAPENIEDDLSDFKVASVSPQPQIVIDCNVDGEFEIGEGVDCAIHIITLLG